MFRLYSRHRKPMFLNEGGITLFTERDFFDHFALDISNAELSIVIESPYLTVRRTKQFVKLFHRKRSEGVQITIYTRHPKHHDKSLEIQAWKSLEILKSAEIRVYLCDDMRHRKLALIDDRISWMGSLNILSQSNSREIMQRTDSRGHIELLRSCL